MILPERQIAILIECSKELTDTTFENPLETVWQLRDVQELVKYGYLSLVHIAGQHFRLTITEKGQLLLPTGI
jgi:hypothetical protein